MKKTRIFAAVMVIVLLSSCILTGCGGTKTLKLEPFHIEWGATQQEAGEQLKCVYLTNERQPNTIFVMSDHNDGSLQAFGTPVSMIIYEFNLVAADSDIRRLGVVTISFPKENYDAVLAYLEKTCGKRYFEDSQWGMKNTEVFLFDNGTLRIEYNSNPITDPANVAEESRDRYIAMNGLRYSSTKRVVESTVNSALMLWRQSTAETDFVKVDNRG